MEKELNLVGILKDCPKGTKLYSTIYGEVEIVEIRNNCTIKDPIIYKYKNVDGYYYVGSATIDGKFTAFPDGECTLFPSKDQRDWDKFKVEPEMIDGEFYYCLSSLTENSFIFIYKKHMSYKTKRYVALSIPSSTLFKNDNDIITNNENIAELRKATEEEKQQLLDAIKIRNYEWDFVKKELIKIEPKFDITTFKPFDKVLVRNFDYECVWRCTFYECFTRGMDYPFLTMDGLYKQCIPYNDETKHLVRTNEMPPEKYITWEE